MIIIKDRYRIEPVTTWQNSWLQFINKVVIEGVVDLLPVADEFNGESAQIFTI